MVLNYYRAVHTTPAGGGGALRDAFLHALRTQGAEMKISDAGSRITKQKGAFLWAQSPATGTRRALVISNADRRSLSASLPMRGSCRKSGTGWDGSGLDGSLLRVHRHRTRPTLARITGANIPALRDLDVNRVFAR